MSINFPINPTRISERFVKVMRTWEICSTPRLLFHGCRENDIGVDWDNCLLSGNKWFSPNEKYAGEYAWWVTRDSTSTPLCAQIKMESVQAVMRPSMHTQEWFDLIHSCFPSAPSDYELSRFIQDIMESHICFAFGREVSAYMSCDGSEVLLPSCETFNIEVSFHQLPPIKGEYIKLFDEEGNRRQSAD